jgi:geranylgeranyl diphosphate synthase type I
MDISYEGRADVSVEDYLAMVERKTAALMAAACGVGARVGGGSAESAAALREFGRQLGLGFQIRDDILGMWGGPSELGKPVGTDLKRNKRSLPIIHALDAIGDKLAAQLAEGVSSDEEAAQIAARMQEIGSRAFCEEMARSFLARGCEALDRVNHQAVPREQLLMLARYLVERMQ